MTEKIVCPKERKQQAVEELIRSLIEKGNLKNDYPSVGVNSLYIDERRTITELSAHGELCATVYAKETSEKEVILFVSTFNIKQ